MSTVAVRRAMSRRAESIVVTMAAVLVVGCSSAADPPRSEATVPPIVSVESRGGLCPDGLCDRTVAIHSDGSVTDQGHSIGRLPPELILSIQGEIDRADFGLILGRPFTGTCPTADDGQETIYTFLAHGGRAVVASCTVAVDHREPLFVAVDAAIAEVPSGR